MHPLAFDRNWQLAELGRSRGVLPRRKISSLAEVKKAIEAAPREHVWEMVRQLSYKEAHWAIPSMAKLMTLPLAGAWATTLGIDLSPNVAWLLGIPCAILALFVIASTYSAFSRRFDLALSEALYASQLATSSEETLEDLCLLTAGRDEEILRIELARRESGESGPLHADHQLNTYAGPGAEL